MRDNPTSFLLACEWQGEGVACAVVVAYWALVGFRYGAVWRMANAKQHGRRRHRRVARDRDGAKDVFR